MVYLIDTSVWIDYLRDKNNASTKVLNWILENDIPFGITGLIYQEILQGALTASDAEKFQIYFSTQRFFHPEDEILSYQLAAKIYFDCRRRGITIRSTVDCLIAQIVIENNLILLHNDADFIQIHKIVPKLRLN